MSNEVIMDETIIKTLNFQSVGYDFECRPMRFVLGCQLVSIASTKTCLKNNFTKSCLINELMFLENVINSRFILKYNGISLSNPRDLWMVVKPLLRC